MPRCVQVGLCDLGRATVSCIGVAEAKVPEQGSP